MEIRDYKPEDFEDVKRIHKENRLAYPLPDINDKDGNKLPLWIVAKVIEHEGKVRMVLGAWVQVELYLWIDKSEWANPLMKHLCIDMIKKSTFKDLWLKGIDHAVLWLPPQFKRFGKRLENEFGFTCTSTNGWLTYSARTGK